MDNLDDINYEDMLEYADKLSDDLMELLPASAKASKEELALWISENEPNYNPEDNG